MEHGLRTQRDREKGQSQLFAAPEEGSGGGGFALAEAAPLAEAQQLAFEKEALGLYLSGHPVSRFADVLRAYGARTSTELVEPLAEMSMGGIVAGLRQLKTKKGDRMAAFSLEDDAGAFEVVVYPETFRQCGALLDDDALVVVRGKFERDEETARIVASEILPLASLQERMTRLVAVRLAAPPHGRRSLQALADLLTRYPGDRPVVLELELRDAAPPLRVHVTVGALRVRPSEQLVAEAEAICGPGAVLLR
jgi:DNA polymerase-3 subunit alpha